MFDRLKNLHISGYATSLPGVTRAASCFVQRGASILHIIEILRSTGYSGFCGKDENRSKDISGIPAAVKRDTYRSGSIGFKKIKRRVCLYEYRYG